jgi:hypothetical protein
MSYEVVKLDGRARAAAKQASRDNDARRLASGEIDKHQLKRENSFFGSISKGGYSFVSMGGKPIFANAS